MQRHAPLSSRFWLLVCGALLVLLLVYPVWGDAYSLPLLRDAIIFGLFALSLDFLWGKGGILSFGHAAFFGIGAYGTGILAPLIGGPAASLIGLLGGIGVAMGVALLVGYFLIFGGVRGAFLTIVTLALSLIAQHIVVGWAEVTGGDAGLIGVPPLGIELLGASHAFFAPVPQYYLVLALALAALLAIWIPCRGQYGRVLKGIQDNEQRAQTLGYNTSLHLLAVFVLSCGLAALAGGLYAANSGFVAPDLVGLVMSTEVIVWVAVGGRGTLIGPFIGAFVVTRLQQEVSSIDTKLWPILIGAFFVAMVFFFPRGLLPLLQRALERLAPGRRRRSESS